MEGEKKKSVMHTRKDDDDDMLGRRVMRDIFGKEWTQSPDEKS